MVIKATIENFTENELKCKCGCGSFNIDNEFLIRLQAFRYMLKQGMIPTSCCRCEKHNKAVGGVAYSLGKKSGEKHSSDTDDDFEDYYYLDEQDDQNVALLESNEK